MTEGSCVIVTCSWCFLLEIVFIIGNSCLLLFLIIVSVFISSLIHHIFVKINAKYHWCIYRPYTYDILCVHWLQMVVLGNFLQYFIAVHIDNVFFYHFYSCFADINPKIQLQSYPGFIFNFMVFRHWTTKLVDKTCKGGSFLTKSDNQIVIPHMMDKMISQPLHPFSMLTYARCSAY